MILIKIYAGYGRLSTREDITLFHKQGYILKRQCLSQPEMQRLNEILTAIVDRAIIETQQKTDISTLSNDEEQITHIDGSRIVFKRRSDNSLSVIRINGCSGMNPSLLDTVRSERMVRTFFELLGMSDLEHLISQVHPKLPGDGVGFPKHRDIQARKRFDPDWKDILGNGSYAICIIPIDSMNKENGGLWIDKNNFPEPLGQEEDLFWVCAEPGDLLFMHPYLSHGSSPNPSPTKSRKTLLTGFCAFGANHQPYPGAHVNVRLTLTEEGNIVTSYCPWRIETPYSGPISGH